MFAHRSPIFKTNSQSIESPADKIRVARERADSSLYKIKPKNQSSYFGNYRKQVLGSQFQVYKCRESKNVRNDLVSLSLIPGIQEITNVNRKIEELVFSEEQKHNWREDLVSDINLAVEAIVKSSSSGDAELFLLTKIVSLEGQLHHLTGVEMSPDQSNSAKFNEAFKKLKKAREILEAKQRQNKSDLSKKILRML